jgi:hypothetical protein
MTVTDELEEPAAPPLCSTAARARGDVMQASAAPVQRWLLVEQPGPWGRDALTQSRFDPGTAQALAQRAAVAGVRVLLIRRPGRVEAVPARRWAYVDSRPGHEGAWWGEFHDEAELLGVALDGTEGRRTDAPAYLVCTHGRHDTCCAVRGRPVAAALAAQRPEQTWECSHLGGDRFAANLLLLPHGLYYGQVGPDDALAVVAAHDAGRVVPRLLRGRSPFSAAAQAAQHYARLALDDDGLDSLLPLDVEDLEADHWRVVLRHRSGAVSVTVRAEAMAEAALLTCSALRPSRARRFRLVALTLPPG